MIGGDFEDALAEGSPERDFAPRSADDRYILYTGGTTGMPKGVVWRHEDVLFALGGGIDFLTGERATAPEDMVARGQKMGFALTFLPIAPLMHGATQWAVMGQSFQGNKVVLMGQFDAHEVWRLVEEEKVNSLMITGDAMARPLVEALDEEPSKGRDLSSLLVAVVDGRGVLAVAEGPVPRPLPERRDDRRHRLVRGRGQRHHRGREGQDRR